MAEIIDISTFGDSAGLSLDMGGGGPSSSFGSGAELLMNIKKPSGGGGGGSDINIDDLSNLEAELNDAVDMDSAPILDISSFGGSSGNIRVSKDGGGGGGIDDIDLGSLNVKFDTGDEPRIGVETLNSGGDARTWDGYGKFNEIPVNPSSHMPASSAPNLSKEETMKEKFGYLKKLEGLERKGVELTKKYSMESSLQEMMGEYEMIISEKERENSVKFQGNMLSAVINGVEFLNNRFDPFDIKLDGWGEQFGENVNDYDDIFGELHEKYKSKAKMAPELKLLFQLAGGAMMVHMTNTMFKSAMPNMDDVMRQNPDLMQQFNRAAVDSLGKTSPGLSGFMNNVMSSSDSTPVNTGPPPAPMRTQGASAPPPPQRQGFMEKRVFASNRPDMTAARGENLDDTYEEINKPVRSSVVRPEMRGPSTPADVGSILSNLKTKTVDMNDMGGGGGGGGGMGGGDDDAGSTISISELKELSAMDGKAPKRSKRRKGSEKNVVSLEL
tara:strand:- start:197 stop:1690 length:1494 start_codon:yes stop_codon:yes gene_type:complete